MKNEIILFENQKVKLEVNVKDETVWLSLEQMSKLFDRDKSVISRHIKNTLQEELDSSTVANFAIVQKEGKRNVTRQVDYYNLDMIISIGYRVKSKNGVIFRKWANSILKDYLLKGYVVNQKRLDYLEKTIQLIDIANRMEDRLEDNDAKEILKVIGGYSKKITYQDCKEIISKLKFQEKSSLFAIERDSGLEAIIGDIYQTYGKEDLYKSIEEKASNFLYMIVKNHIFIDGNKRIAATLFIYFLNFYHILYKNGRAIIDNNTLTALTLLVAESNPKEKEVLIDLIMNFLG